MSTTTPTTRVSRILRRSELRTKTGLGPSRIDELERRGDFPARVRLSERAVGWFEHDVKPRLRGEAYLIRYADDFIGAFEWEDDARRFQDVLRKRLARFSLELAEDKTLRFGRFAARESTRRGERRRSSAGRRARHGSQSGRTQQRPHCAQRSRAASRHSQGAS